MPLIFQERFDIGREIRQRSVGAHVFHVPSYPPMRERGIDICGISEGSGAFEVERIGAPFHALLFCLAGTLELYQGDMRWLVEPGQLGILPAMERRGFRRIGDEPCRLVWLLLSDQSRWHYLHAAQCQVRDSMEGQTLHDAVSLFQRETARLNAGHADAQAVSALDLVVTLLERALHQLRPSAGWPAQLQALFAKADEDLSRDWSIDELAARLHITPAHLHRLCQQHLGCAPGQYLFQLRMRRAREMLQNGHPVGDVAQAVGYHELASFSRRFRQHFDMSPSAARGMPKMG
ncbi:helix-turn-helix transcriptional regulator [Andreprevotia chitinilytica]|uniref:helix-turn-helix transcriptional regulator n=1 Tax=Andreprevotia chitinilytica TaxID=396808 RepID=UPI0005597134|nr:AraC family transcriptional regulator [Andreprevotia chitinilytica]